MTTNATALKRGPNLDETSVVNYFGVLVELIDSMEHCRLIGYRDRDLVVDTEICRTFRVLQP